MATAPATDAAPAETPATAKPSEADVARALELKNEGNAHFKAKAYAKAVDLYSQSLELNESAPVLGNRAFANLKLEAFGLAIADASRALKIDPKFVKGYYRRGSANLALGKYKPARRDFRVVLSVRPADPAAKAQLKHCEAEIKRKAFEAAIATDKTAGPWEAVEEQLGSMSHGAGYSGPVMPEAGPTPQYCRDLMEHCRLQRLPSKKDVWRLLQLAYKHFKAQATLVRVPIPAPASAETAAAASASAEAAGSQPDGCVCVMGDTHGQYYDTLHVFSLTGEPCASRTLLFNGDFVDRGSFSVENVLVLLAWQLACPANFFMLRGNHETANMNKVYGFDGEVRAKYDGRTMDLFADVFRAMPLAAVVGERAFVCHGGLFSKDGVSLADIEATPRFQEPPESGIMSDLLWSDPQPFPGRGPSKRGVGHSFGPDITAAFLDSNGLEFMLRSHEVRDEGFTEEHNSRLFTVFSAPNYCDQAGNKGAFMRVRAEGKPEPTQFSAQPHPPVPPMKYAGMGMLGGLGM